LITLHVKKELLASLLTKGSKNTTALLSYTSIELPPNKKHANACFLFITNGSNIIEPQLGQLQRLVQQFRQLMQQDQ
jgi:hypothetical protein